MTAEPDIVDADIVDADIVDAEIVDAEIVTPAEPIKEDEVARRRRVLFDWAVVIVVALLVAFLVRTFVLAHFVVDGTSMASTLHDDDRVFVNKLSYRLHDPNRGDVVVLHQISGTSERDLIKRVIALPGETIEVRNCQVFVDGRILEEPYLDEEVLASGSCGGDVAPTSVPEDHVYVMGDNRAGSQDSRALGPIDEDDLVGRAFVVFWPGRTHSGCDGFGVQPEVGRRAAVSGLRPHPTCDRATGKAGSLDGGGSGARPLPPHPRRQPHGDPSSASMASTITSTWSLKMPSMPIRTTGRMRCSNCRSQPKHTRSKRWNSVVSPPVQSV